mmetsp:Transcript_7236/g.12626  ORF Transcript_7236/g.12626 Transcript_7236/m.12626 type:complete len:430 (+) Transcript_7236:26-1315(+)
MRFIHALLGKTGVHYCDVAVSRVTSCGLAVAHEYSSDKTSNERDRASYCSNHRGGVVVCSSSFALLLLALDVGASSTSRNTRVSDRVAPKLVRVSPDVRAVEHSERSVTVRVSTSTSTVTAIGSSKPRGGAAPNAGRSGSRSDRGQSGYNYWGCSGSLLGRGCSAGGSTNKAQPRYEIEEVAVLVAGGANHEVNLLVSAVSDLGNGNSGGSSVLHNCNRNPVKVLDVVFVAKVIDLGHRVDSNHDLNCGCKRAASPADLLGSTYSQRAQRAGDGKRSLAAIVPYVGVNKTEGSDRVRVKGRLLSVALVLGTSNKAEGHRLVARDRVLGGQLSELRAKAESEVVHVWQEASGRGTGAPGTEASNVGVGVVLVSQVDTVPSVLYAVCGEVCDTASKLNIVSLGNHAGTSVGLHNWAGACNIKDLSASASNT